MEINADIERAISTARLQSYLERAANDEQAWAIYRWNLELAAAFGPLISDVEVSLRNTIHTQLSGLYGRADWWAHDRLILDDDTRELLTSVVSKFQKGIKKGTVSPGKVIAELTLGVWVHLLSRGGNSRLGRTAGYEKRLWRTSLRLGFDTGELTPKGRARRPTRKAVHSRAAHIQKLRNRAAHHEPLMDGIREAGTGKKIPLETLQAEAIELLQWMSPTLAAHHRADLTISQVLSGNPQR